MLAELLAISLSSFSSLEEKGDNVALVASLPPRTCRYCGASHVGSWHSHDCPKRKKGSVKSSAAPAACASSASSAFSSGSNTMPGKYVRLAFDSGATSSMMGTNGGVNGADDVCDEKGIVVRASGHVMSVCGRRVVSIVTDIGARRTTVKEVRELVEPLLSVSQLCREGWSISFSEGEAVLRNGRETVYARKVNGLYLVPVLVEGSAVDVSCAVRELLTPETLHARLGHMSYQFVKRGIKAGIYPELRVRTRGKAAARHEAVCSGCSVLYVVC